MNSINENGLWRGEQSCQNKKKQPQRKHLHVVRPLKKAAAPTASKQLAALKKKAAANVKALKAAFKKKLEATKKAAYAKGVADQQKTQAKQKCSPY